MSNVENNDCIIRVGGLRTDIDDEMLSCIFENKRIGGGVVDKVDHVPRSTTALITFADKSVAARLVEKAFIEFDGMKLKLSRPLVAGTEQDGTGNSESAFATNSLQVIGRPQLPSRDMLMVYFESSRSGGGDLIDVICDKDKATIVFKEPTDAMNVLSRESHKVNNCQLEVFALDNDPFFQCLEPCAIHATGLPANWSTDMVYLFFESSKRSGGGEIDGDIIHNAQTGSATITFQSPSVASRVISHQPLTADNNAIRCELLALPPPPPLVPEENADPLRLLLTVRSAENFDDTELEEFMKKATGGHPEVCSLVHSQQQHGIVLVEFDDVPGDIIKY